MSQVEDGSLSSADKKSLVTEVVMYLISQEASKVPAKRVSIIKTILAHHSKSFRLIMSEAKDVLLQVFGYELLEHDGRYFLKNKYESSELGQKILREPLEHRIRTSLLMLVLSLIFMEGGTVRDELVWDFLRLLRVRVGDMPDPVFGNVKRVLTKDCVHMLYLQHTRREGSDPTVYEFSLGPRAMAEISKRKLLEFVCKIYGKNESSWPVHLKQVEQSEESEAPRLSQLLSKRMRLSQPSSSQRASSQGASSQRTASQRAASQRAASQRAASQRAASQRAASQRAASQRAASQRATSQRASSQSSSQGRSQSPQAGPSSRP